MAGLPSSSAVRVTFQVTVKSQTVWHWWCCGHCDMRHVATVSNHIQNKSEQIQFSPAHFSMYRCAQSVRTSHMMLHAHAWLKFKVCLPQHCHSISCAMSDAFHGTRSTSSSSLSSVPGLRRLLTSRNPCADPREHGGDGYIDPEPLTFLTQQAFTNSSYFRMVTLRSRLAAAASAANAFVAQRSHCILRCTD